MRFSQNSFFNLSSFLSSKLSAFSLKDVHGKYVKTSAFCIHFAFCTLLLVCICFLASFFSYSFISNPTVKMNGMPTAILAGLTLQEKNLAFYNFSKHFRANMSETLCSEFITFLHMSELGQYCRCRVVPDGWTLQQKWNCVKRTSSCSSSLASLYLSDMEPMGILEPLTSLPSALLTVCHLLHQWRWSKLMK